MCQFLWDPTLLWVGLGHSSVKELFTPGQEAAGARPSRAQVRNSSSETHLLKTVASGGAWHSQEDGEETLLTNPKSRPDRHKTELGRGSCHREEESEEALATRLPSWARIPPVLPIAILWQ